MLKYREVRTGSGNTAVQVYYIQNRKRVIVKHIGSATNRDELHDLKQQAQQFIADYCSQTSLFPSLKSGAYVYLEQYECVGYYYRFFYDTIQRLIAQMGFEALISPLLKDLITIRILEPASKLRSIELIETYFGIVHRRQNYYKEAKKWIALKDKILEKVNDFGRKEYGLDYSVVFYDVTTLYFETFEEDDLRKKGFSKDNKSQQPQILVGLIVSQEGFPLAFDIFAGNTFEEKNHVKHFTVVADAAMISADNIKALKAQGIHYIVGGKTGQFTTTCF